MLTRMQSPLLHYKKFNKLNTQKKVSISQELASLVHGIWHDRLDANAIVVTYLAARNFKIVRFPTRPDRAVDGKGRGFSEAAKLLDNYSDKDLDRLANELRDATSATQEILRANYGDGPIPLQRAVAPLCETHGQSVSANRDCDPIETFALLAEAARQAKVPFIALDFDIVSGWSPSALARYGTLHMQRYWQIEEVMLVSDLLVGPSGSQPMENDEWLCINRSPRGILNIASCDFDVVNLPQMYLDKINSLRNSDGGNRIKALAQELQAAAIIDPTLRGFCMRPPSGVNLKSPAIPEQSILSKLQDCWEIIRGKPKEA